MINTCHHKKRIIENARAREAGKREGQEREARETGKREGQRGREMKREREKNDKKIDERSSTIQSTNRRRIDST